MVTRRRVLATFALAFAGQVTLRAGERITRQPKLTTVTLTIEGMT
jgi:hypothetical protein